MAKAWQQVRDEIESATNTIWLEEPLEIKKLRMGLIDSKAGTYGQYFSTMVFVNGDIRALACYYAGGLARSAAIESISLESLKEQVQIFLPASAKFLGYCGLKSVWELTQDIIEALPSIKTKEEFKELLGSFNIYCGRLHIWTLNILPWELGMHYPQRDRQDLEEMLELVQQYTAKAS
jgi:hypothetical protein